MPALVYPELKPWPQPPETTTELDYAPLAVLDFAKWDAPGGKEELAAQLKEASHTMGFWTIINPGIPQDVLDTQFALANTFFTLPQEEKEEITFIPGESCWGYRPPGTIKGTEFKENLEMVNMHKFTEGTNYPRHTFMKRYEPLITSFQKLVFEQVINKIFVLMAIMLELPENHFTDMHKFEKASDDHVRFIKYRTRTVEEDKAVSDQWMAGHTDFGSVTLLFPQPIAALQVRTPEDEWKWVRYVPGGIVCNAADLIALMTKNYVKSAIHRVMRPPPDQANLERMGIFFFVRPTNDVIIKPNFSPVLQREGLWTKEDEEFKDEDAATCGEFVIARMQNFNPSRTKEQRDKEVLKVKQWEVVNKYI
uniref:Flavonol synthase n=1 Tax=Mycena chlorophos TaxID=658473 RepID=A0ABQ0LDT5_MYCCL|nr:flavonol synthase [Mycena chlorophos]